MELPKRKEVPELLRPYRDIRHPDGVFRINQLTLFDDFTADGNRTINVYWLNPTTPVHH